jgi:predicted nucleotidyltransferase component of viral defense system
MALSVRQSIEMFHLVFLRALVAKGDAKGMIALKGGCNLRFYFGSVRHSEDIDFDVIVIATGMLKNKVERLLKSPLVTAPLKSKGIAIVDMSAPKQTDTTQRWKIGLQVEHIDVALRTKIEFSRRDAIDGAAFEAADRAVLQPYGLTQVLAMHYTTAHAIQQKILALAGRTEPQARDVFDLHLLLARPDALKGKVTVPKRSLSNALEHAIGISFEEYRSKVVAYLDEEQAPLYEDRAAWNAMQDAVVSRLEGLS